MFKSVNELKQFQSRTHKKMPLKIISLATNNINQCGKLFRNSSKNRNFLLASCSNIPRVKLVTNIEYDKNNIKKRKLNEFNEDYYEDETDSHSLKQSGSSNKCVKLDEYDEKKILEKQNDLEALEYLDIEELNERQLWVLTNAYDNLVEWKTLANLLNLSKQDVDLIEFNYLNSLDGLRECFYQCLLKWRLIQPENCYFSYFCKVLTSKKLNKSKALLETLAQSLLQRKHNENNDSKIILRYYINNIQAKNSNDNETDFSKFNLSEKQLWLTSEIICTEWKSIARYLGLNESDISDIYFKHARFEGIRECSYQSLLLWSQTYSTQSNLEHLCLSLINMRFNFFAKKLLEKFLLI